MKNNVFYQLMCVVVLNFLIQSIALCNNYPSQTTVFCKTIKSVKVKKTGVEISYPVNFLSSNIPLCVSFDELSSKEKRFFYRVSLCDANWTLSNVLKMEYYRGMDAIEIIDAQQSINTLVDYYHYSFTIPSEEYTILLPGNYLIEVFEEKNQSLPVFQTRVMLVDNRITVKAEAKRSSYVENMDFAQELQLSITLNKLKVRDPFNDIKVTVIQNGRWQASVTDLKPSFVNNDELTYLTEQEYDFVAGNEFRRFDFKMFKYPAENVKEFSMSGHTRSVELNEDKPRKYLQYFDRGDINGQYYVSNSIGQNSSVDADYALVQFNLQYEIPEVVGEVYLYGAMTDWAISPDSKMEYDLQKKAYSKTILLKQGYYDYQYVLFDSTARILDYAFFENSHWETENDYQIIVYHSDAVVGYDKIIGYAFVNSRNKVVEK